MSIETPETAAVVAADTRGVPTRITNLRDVENEAALPTPTVWIDAPAGYSHGSPPTSPPYETGPSSTPSAGDDDHE
jgi:hypothetical protein